MVTFAGCAMVSGLFGQLRHLFCARGTPATFVRNIHGDEVFECGGKRSIWRCSECDAMLLRDEPRLPDVETISERWQAVGFEKELGDRIEAALQPRAQIELERDAAPALLAALRRTWEVIDDVGLDDLCRGVDAGRAYWLGQANKARDESLAAIDAATGITNHDMKGTG